MNGAAVANHGISERDGIDQPLHGQASNEANS
jgi:hypothetical protein